MKTYKNDLYELLGRLDYAVAVLQQAPGEGMSDVTRDWLADLLREVVHDLEDAAGRLFNE